MTGNLRLNKVVYLYRITSQLIRPLTAAGFLEFGDVKEVQLKFVI